LLRDLVFGRFGDTPTIRGCRWFAGSPADFYQFGSERFAMGSRFGGYWEIRASWQCYELGFNALFCGIAKTVQRRYSTAGGKLALIENPRQTRLERKR
jgi:hypothetical protein